MGISVGQFVASLSTNGILPAAQISAIGEKFSADDWQTDADALVRQLVRDGKLTKFQAVNLYQGRGKGLVYGEYVVLDKLGEGGMGQVYRAQHRRMKRIVALKILPPSAVDSPRAIQRFHQEVEVAAQLQHPNIVVAYDAGEAHGRHFLVMEHVDGSDLSSYVKQHGPLGVEQAANVILQAARGLAYAHGLGIIHRDIKPSNLLVNRQGAVKILDLGLARYDNPLADASVPASELTTSGEVMGTIDYMAPEQAADTRTADHRTDIYALGCTLYRLLTGNPPYTGETMIQKILAHREQPIPSLCAARGDVPAVLDRIYQKMMAKPVADRTPAMSQVVSALEKLLGGVSDERSSVMLGEEGPPKDDNFDLSLLPMPSAGPSGILATAANVSGSSVGGSKPGSTNAGMQSAPTQFPTVATAVPRPPPVVTAQRVEPPPPSEPPQGISPLLLFGGGVATAAIIGAALFFVLRRNDEPTAMNVATDAAPTATTSATSAPKTSPKSTPSALPPTSSPTPSGVTQIPVVTSTVSAVSFFGGTPSPSPAVPTATVPSPTPTPSPTATKTSPPPVTPTATAAATAVAALPNAPEIAPSPTADSTSSPVAGIDLLKLVDVKRDSIVGAWEFVGGELRSPLGGPGNPRTKIPYKLPKEYVLRLTVQPTTGGPLYIGFPVGGSYVEIVLDRGTIVSGLEHVDGMDFKSNPTTVKNPRGLAGSQPMEITIRVDGSSVQTTLNGEMIVDWRGDPKSLALGGGFEGGVDRAMPFVGTYNNAQYHVRRFELLPFEVRRLPVPPTDALASAQAKVRELVGEMPSNAPAVQKSTKAIALRDQAILNNDVVLRFALLNEAIRLATAAEDVPLVVELFHMLRQNYDVDATAQLATALEPAVARSRPVKERTDLITLLRSTADAQADEERFDLAGVVIKAAEALAAKTTDTDLKKELKYREQEVEEYRKLFESVRAARQTLASDSEDSAANLAVGTYLAVARGDWRVALQHLVKGNDAVVQSAAQLEIQYGSDPAKAADVAAAWIEAADKAPLAAKAVFFELARQRFADGAASTKSVATSKMLTRFKKVEGDVLRTAGSAFVKRHPVGATAYGGHWYQFFPEKVTWHKARDRCRQLGGRLVCIETPTENQWLCAFVVGQYDKSEQLRFWIGGTEEGHDGVYTWLNGSPVQFTDWTSGEPTNNASGHAMNVSRSSNEMKWWEDPPNNEFLFVCEWDR